MTLFERVTYAWTLAIVSAAAIGLGIAILSADSINLIPIEVFDYIFSPAYMIALYILSFIISPIVANYLPEKRENKK